jgi:hypothetical protein
VTVLERDDSECLDLFVLVGLLPGGINEEQLKILYGEKWEQHSKKLKEYSLISERIKEVDGDTANDQLKSINQFETSINEKNMGTFNTDDEDDLDRELLGTERDS